MLQNIYLERILFLDIETVPITASYDMLPDHMQKLWDKKSERIRKNDEDLPSDMYRRAGIYSEFGKIICISAGFIKQDTFRIKSFFGDDESTLLIEFAALLKSHYYKDDDYLCAHNGKEFDFPYIARRMIIQGIPLPGILNLAGKKPWEVKHLDTMELWKFGDYKNYTSLDLLTNILNIPSPKDDIDGSDIADLYWKEKDLERIVNYCQKDVLAVAQVLYRFLNKPLINKDKVIITE